MKKNRCMLLFLMFFLALLPASAQGEGRITMSFENEGLPSALRRLEKASAYKIVFTYDDVERYRVSGSVKDVTFENALKYVLNGKPLGYKFSGKLVYVTALENEAKVNVSGAKVISGIVRSSEDGEPVIGATVKVVGSSQAATTDAEGRFRFQNLSPNAQLQVSYLGMKTITVPAGSSLITLDTDANSVDEVVVNGFFTRQKQTFTGAARTFSADEILQITPNNLLQALSTLDAGLTITQNNIAGSNPNVVPDLIIRSTTSLATNDEVGLNAPLIVIDGVETNLQAMYDIDIHDIERVDILKDASATALYGENAANGVIVIERKRVSQSPVRIRYTFTPKFSFADLSSYDVCNAAQKLELERLAGLYDSPSGALDQSYYDKMALVNSGLDVDWLSKPVRNSFSHDHSLSITGRGSGLDYNITGNFSRTAGVMKDDARNKYGLGVYLSYRAVDKLIVTLRASHNTVNTEDSPYGAFSAYMYANPYDSPYDENGNYSSRLSYGMNNPLYEASLSSFSKSQTRTENLSVDVRYNFMPNLYVTAQGAYSSARGTSDKFVSPKSNNYYATTVLSQKGSYTLGNNGSDSWSGKIVGNYIHNFDKEGTMLTLNLGGELKRTDTYSRLLTATGFLSDDMTDIVYATAYPEGAYPTGSEDVATSMGVFVAGNFVWRNRYFIDGSYRLSGSSKFGENHRYAPFWSIGLGYNLHNEDFIKNLGWVNTFRLRGSYGYTGSVKFNAFQAITTYKYDSDYAYYAGVGARPIAMSNPDLKWQTTKKLNIGFTSAFLDNRLNVNFDYYHEKTTDMLIDLSLPPSSGATAVKDNLGSQTSKGVEFSVWGKIIKTRDWEWNLSVNGLHSTTTINNISEALKRKNEENGSNNTNASPLIQFREGESPTAIYAVRSAGIDPASGKEIFITKDGNYTYNYDANDQVAVGDVNPALQGSISSMVKWKSLSLTAAFSYRLGCELYNSTRAAKVENINPRYNADVRAFTERWKKPGDVVPYLNISATGGQTYVHTDRFVEKNNELWLSSIYAQYDLPTEWIRPLKLQKVYVGAGLEDLFRLTSATYERGTSYPYSRSLNLSLSVTF